MSDAMHPSEIIREELDARGWSMDRLAIEMGGNFGINRLALDMYFEVGPTDSNLRIGEAADDLGRAFGVSGQFFRNLEVSWLASAPPAPAASPGGA